MQFVNKDLLKYTKDNPYISIRFLYLVLATVLTISLFSINFATRKEKVLSAGDNPEVNNLVYQKKYWQNFLFNNPEYFDGWYELSLIEAKLGQFENAYISINKALSINPNSERATIIKNSIESKIEFTTK